MLSRHSILPVFLSRALFLSALSYIPESLAEAVLDEVVVTASRNEQALRDVAVSVSVLDSDDLALSDHIHIQETMVRSAGVWVSRGNGQEHLTAIRSPVLTGAGSCGAFLISQDGIPLRAPGFCNVNELFESTSELAERIEVMKGPGSSTHGYNALHGIINVITPAPQDGLRRASLLAGPWNYLRSRLTVSSDSLRMDMSGTSDGGYKDDSGFDQQKLLLTHRHENGDQSIKTTFSYTNLNQETAGFVEGPEVYRRSGIKRDNPNPEAYRDARSFRLVSSISRALGQGQLLLKPYARHVDMVFLQHFLPGQAIEENGHDSLGLLGLWTSELADWRLGIEMDYTRGYLKETQPGPTGISPFLDATIPAGAHYDYEVDALMTGVFAQHERLISETLKLTAGLRYQLVSYDYDNRMISGRTREDGTPCGFGGCRFSRPADRQDSFHNWSPRLGLVWDWQENHQVFASLTQGYRAPQATELYRLQNNQQVARINPVKLTAFELGFRGQTEKSDYTLSLFAMNKDNFIFRDTNRLNVDNGRTSHRGLELEYRYQFNAAWSAALAMTLARHRYENSPLLSRSPLEGNDIDTAPETLGSARIGWRPASSLSLELEWVHVGRYYEDPENQHPYDGHDLMNFRGRWQMNPGMAAQFRIMNLTDQDYAERADFAFGNDRYFVGTPRAVFLGLEITF